MVCLRHASACLYIIIQIHLFLLYLMTEQNNEHESIFKVIKKDFFSIPVSIRIISLSIFLFLLGRWLGADTFFSVYAKTIVNNIFLISVGWAILALIRMIFSIPIGKLDDHSNIKFIIFLSKWIYFITGILYFLAWVYHSMWILLVAIILNWIATAWLMITYQTFIREHSRKNNRSSVFWLYFSSANFAYVIGALIASVLIKRVDIHYLFLFVSIFSVISFFIDEKLPNLSKKKLKEFLWKESFIHQFMREIFGFRWIKSVWEASKWFSHKLYHAFGFEFLFNVLNYIGFIFIPIVSLQNHLTLSQIAIIFAVMRIPYLIEFFSWEIADRYNKKKFILIVLLFLSLLFALLWFKEWFAWILTISFGISLGLALIRPVISWLISDNADSHHAGTITWFGEFVGRFGDIFWSIGFGVLAVFMWIQNSFVIVGICVFVMAAIWLIKRWIKKMK